MSDRDATLLTALMTHDGEAAAGPKPAAEVRTKKASEPKSRQVSVASAKQSGKPPSKQPSKQSADFDPKRDVVEDDKNVSTAELVRRCGTLGLMEGFLCKARVCSSRQNNDPACPHPSEPLIGGG